MLEGLKAIKHDRAKIERDRVVLESMVADDVLSQTFFEHDELDFGNELSDADIEQLIDRIPESDDDEGEIQRVIDKKDGAGIDDILDIEDGIDVDALVDEM